MVQTIQEGSGQKMDCSNIDCDPDKVREVVADMSCHGIDEYNALNAVVEQAQRLSIELNDAEKSEAASQLLECAARVQNTSRPRVRT